MLQDCNAGQNTITKLKQGQMPSADKIALIAQYLEVSIEYLMGLTEDPTPPKKELTREEKLLAEIYKLNPSEFETAEKFIGFLKTQQGFSQELAESLASRIMEPSQE